MAYPRKIVAKMSVEMKTIWHSTMPYLHDNTLNDSTAISICYKFMHKLQHAIPQCNLNAKR